MRDRRFDDLVSDAYQRSVKPLYPYLNIAILGPYEGDCFAYLTHLKLHLQEASFSGAKLATDRGGSPDEEASDAEIQSFYRDNANRLMDESDVGIFVFLDHSFSRTDLRDDALEAAREPDENPREVNIAVSSELEYWINNFRRDRAIMMVEDSIQEDLSSRVRGFGWNSEVHWRDIDDQDIDSTCTEGFQRCRNWVLGELREVLWKRYRSDQHF